MHAGSDAPGVGATLSLFPGEEGACQHVLYILK